MSIAKVLRIASLLVTTILSPFAVWADDTDIYINNSAPPGSEPLVMFSVDYRSNLTASICTSLASGCPAAAYFARELGYGTDIAAFNTGENMGGKLNFFDNLRLALKVVTNRVSGSGIKIGLMMSHNNENNCTGLNATLGSGSRAGPCSNGGTVLMGFTPISTGRTTFNAKLDKLKALKPTSSSPDHSYQGAELFFEFFRYLTGQGIYNGHNGGVDFESGGSVDRSTNMDHSSYQPASWDAGIETESRRNYVSPLAGISGCARIYTINFLFQVANQESDSLSEMNLGKGLGGLGTTIPSNDPFTPTIEFLNEADLSDGSFGTSGNANGVQNVTSYFFVDPRFINNTTTGYARAGGTVKPLPLGDNPEQLVNDLVNVFRQILSVSTTFVAASVPVNVFNRATLVDNVYIALFQADKDSRPYWNGNIKKLKLKETTLADGSKDVDFVDRNGAQAVADDGRIKFDALTFWTNPTPLTDSDEPNNIVVGKDGRHVNRGGAGQKIAGFVGGAGPGDLNATAGARQLFYDASTSSLAALNADTATATALMPALDTASPSEALEILKYIRGQDTADFDLDSDRAEPRPWIFGDPLHSRPLPINYGATLGYSKQNPAIFIAIGSNDGFLRLLRNTKSGATEVLDDVDNGKEIWAFMPKSVMGIQNTLRKNEALTPARHPYGFDGPPTVYMQDVDGDGNIEPSDGDKVYLYAGLRRGGRAYYALDITNPLAPSLMWSISNATTGFSELGQTFPTPKTGMIRVGTVQKPAVFFSGGYDTNKDYVNTPGVGDNDGQGRAIYVVDAVTGALIWKAVNGASKGANAAGDTYTHPDLLDSIPSDLIVADTDGDRLMDRILVGDAGGKVWRADFTADGDRQNWKLVLRANLGRHANSGKLNDRRFFHAPDLVPSRDGNATSPDFDAIVIGTGDREDPLDKSGVAKNFFYVIKDRAIGVGGAALVDSALTHDDIPDVTTTCLPGATCSLDLTTGWKVALAEGSGEKSLASPITFNNTIFFTSYLPPAGGVSSEVATCGPAEGGGFLYAVNLKDGTAAYNFDVIDDVADGDGDGDTSPDGENPNSSGDRNKALSSSGIPAQVVLIPTSTGINAIAPDLSTFKPKGTNRYRTYWQRVEQ